MGGPLAVLGENQGCWSYRQLWPLVGVVRTRLKLYLLLFTHSEQRAPNVSVWWGEWGACEHRGFKVKRLPSHLGHRALGQVAGAVSSWIQ